MPDDKPPAVKFREPLMIQVARPTGLVSVGLKGQPMKQWTPGVAEIKTPQHLHDLTTVALQGELRIIPELAVQLFLIQQRQAGNIIPADSPAGPTGLVGLGDGPN